MGEGNNEDLPKNKNFFYAIFIQDGKEMRRLVESYSPTFKADIQRIIDNGIDKEQREKILLGLRTQAAGAFYESPVARRITGIEIPVENWPTKLGANGTDRWEFAVDNKNTPGMTTYVLRKSTRTPPTK